MRSPHMAAIADETRWIPWAVEDFLQPVAHFRDVCKLPGEGLDASLIPDTLVSPNMLKYHFGEKKQNNGYKYRDTHVDFDINDIVALSQIVDGHPKPVNNALTVWFAKGLIAERILHKKVNWAQFAHEKHRHQLTSAHTARKPRPTTPPLKRLQRVYVIPACLRGVTLADVEGPVFAPLHVNIRVEVDDDEQDRDLRYGVGSFGDLTGSQRVPACDGPLSQAAAVDLEMRSEPSVVEGRSRPLAIAPPGRIPDFSDTILAWTTHERKIRQGVVDMLKVKIVQLELDQETILSSKQTAETHLSTVKSTESECVRNLGKYRSEVQELCTKRKKVAMTMDSIGEDDEVDDEGNAIVDEARRSFELNQMEQQVASLDEGLSKLHHEIEMVVKHQAQNLPEIGLAEEQVKNVIHAQDENARDHTIALKELQVAENQLAAIIEEEQHFSRHIERDTSSRRQNITLQPTVIPTSLDVSEKFWRLSSCPVCNWGFHCGNWVPTPCGHTFHPACLFPILTASDAKCEACLTPFHPDFLACWGLPPSTNVAQSVIGHREALASDVQKAIALDPLFLKGLRTTNSTTYHTLKRQNTSLYKHNGNNSFWAKRATYLNEGAFGVGGTSKAHGEFDMNTTFADGEQGLETPPKKKARNGGNVLLDLSSSVLVGGNVVPLKWTSPSATAENEAMAGPSKTKEAVGSYKAKRRVSSPLAVLTEAMDGSSKRVSTRASVAALATSVDSLPDVVKVEGHKSSVNKSRNKQTTRRSRDLVPDGRSVQKGNE